jgi:inner membrane protein
MASIFGHALVSLALGKTFSKKQQTWKLFLLAIICAIMPDADVIGFYFGVSYGSFWGHRGFSHSILFALIFGILITFIFCRKQFLTTRGLYFIFFFFLCTISHAILDAMTTGGKGVAFLSPFDTTRYFFPWRPIRISPLGIKKFFTSSGITVLLSELHWIGIPSVLYIIAMLFIKKRNTKNEK